MYGNKMSAIFHLKYQNTVTNLGVNFFKSNLIQLRFSSKNNSGFKTALNYLFCLCYLVRIFGLHIFESADKTEIIISLISCV